ncbi:MAG: DNA internalization-related competence protein ComEC/Rec2 [Candidatus Kryptonium sp.]|nr:DNA internalization-related competence protein ComEC/Rec2 [Candidatus Kryptonium sp.]
MRSRPALKFSLALIVGILAQHFLKFSIETLILSLFSLAILHFTLSLLKANLLKIFSIYLIVITIGALKYLADTELQPQNSIVNFANDTAIVKIQGKLISHPEFRNNRANFIISAQKIFKANEEINVSGNVFVSIRKGKAPSDTLPALDYGDQIQIIGILREPLNSRNPDEFNFARYLKINDIEAVFLSYIQSHVKIIKEFEPRISEPIEAIRSFAYKIRSFALKVFDKLLSPQESAFAKGLVLGYRGEISKDVQEYFINTGTYHILAVSGLNVGIITLMFFVLTSFFRVDLTIRVILTLIGIIIYALITDLPPSVVRATLMASIVLIGMALERRVDIYNLLGFSALLILLFNSKQIFHPGFQLSFSAVASIVYFYPKTFKFVSKFSPSLTSGYILPITSLVIVSLSAQILTLPFTISYFNKISLISLIANVFIVPLASLSVPLGFAVVLFHPISEFIAQTFANTLWLVLNLTISIAKFFAQVPFSYIESSKEVSIYIFLLIVFFVVFLKIKFQSVMKRIIFAILIIANLYIYFAPNGVISSLTSETPYSSSNFEITVLDVGQGDAIFVQFPDGKNLLVDGGNKTFNFDPGERIIEPFLKRKGVRRIDAILVTHPHNDHIGGIPYILENFEVGMVIDNGLSYNSSIYQKYIEIIRKKGIKHITARAGNKIELTEQARIYILHPTEFFVKAKETEKNYNSGQEINNSSVVIKIQYGNNSFLLTGDAEKEAEEAMIRVYDTFLKSDWIKVGHHGSETSSSPAFVLKVKPQWAVISVGKYNKYNHPSDIVLRRYNLIGTKIHRTDEEGAGVFRSDGIKIEKVEWRN